jgi:hypothetical protein
MLLGVVFTAFYSARERKKSRVKTYIGENLKYLWIGMGASYFVLSFILTKQGWGTSIFPFFIMLYGLGTFVSGFILRFRPLIIGGEIAWGLAIGAVYLDYDYQMLCAAVAILVSYIIPAYMLQNRNKQSNI